MNPILLLILFIVFCVITAILCFRLLHEEKNNKRREEKRIRELMEIPAYVNGEIEKRLNMLYDYIRVFPEKEQECQKLLSIVHKTKDEIARLVDQEGVSKKERKKVRTKYNKREIEWLKFTPADIKCEMYRSHLFLYDYFNAFPEKKQGCQELLLLIDKTWSEAERLEEDSGYYADIL